MCLALTAVTLSLASNAVAQTETVLYSFKNSPDGAHPQSGLVLRDGNLYGTTGFGGENNEGTVFELRRTATGWAEKVLYKFTGGSDGGSPYGALTFDNSGNLYGTTTVGGITSGDCPTSGCGVVFELTSSPSGWTETVIHSFTGGSDGLNPLADLATDRLGNIYGASCGDQYCFTAGNVFELMPSGSSWNYAVIASGVSPSNGKLAIDTEGNLYGANYFGGNDGCILTTCGTVFELSRSGGSWTTTTSYSFSPGASGSNPFASVTLGPSGLFGTAQLGGSGNAGTVFELHHSHGVWSETPLYAFTDGVNGYEPAAAVVIDKSGNVFSWALSDGDCDGDNCGLVFELSPPNGGRWSERVVHNFGSTNGDGWGPYGSLTLDSVGNLYGVTFDGGAGSAGGSGNGTVYEITP
jgi:uncharacterized repeat protein (TIGR03803 family)